MNDTILWIGEVKWKLNTFTVEVELERESSGVYVSEIRALYWWEEKTGEDKEIVDLVVDVISDKDYSSLTEVIVASYLDSKQKVNEDENF